MTESQPAQDPACRAEWLGLLARAPALALHQAASPVLADLTTTWLRRPELGLVMLRARIGNSGDRYNVGEAIVARCAVRARTADSRCVVGVGYVLGRDLRQAEQIAGVDAMLQAPQWQALAWQQVIEPLRERVAQHHAEYRAAAEATRVRFYTLQPEVAR
jgi:alpha-D-ribose 1-methylphosphonate 5-triphosphate synthase subunit PhnG